MGRPGCLVGIAVDQSVTYRQRWTSDSNQIRILQLDPGTGHVETFYEGTVDHPYFTDAIGKHQYQPNGNLLITESWRGRVFEVTPAGKKVWEFVNRYDENRAALIEWALRYPTSYADFPKDCPATPSGGS